MSKLVDDTKTEHADAAPQRAEGERSAAREASYKPREGHPGQLSPHLGQTHMEKDQLLQSARKIDEGPSFGTPGEPPPPNPDSLTEIEQAFEDLGREESVVRSG